MINIYTKLMLDTRKSESEFSLYQSKLLNRSPLNPNTGNLTDKSVSNKSKQSSKQSINHSLT